MPGINEQKFYDALRDLFVGAKIEGKSGYVNLMKVKSNYFQKVLNEFKKQVDFDPILQTDFREEFFDKLYDFFHKYFSESGSVYFVKTYVYDRIYERIYSDNKDVALFWKTHMLYYVKTDILVQGMDIEVEDTNGVKYYFYFDASEIENKQNNEKRELVFDFVDVKKEFDDDGKIKYTVILKVSYSERGKKTKKEEILKNVRKVMNYFPEELLDKAIRIFKKQSEVDYFINKDAKSFLEEQLNLYLHKILLNEENKFTQQRLDQIKTIQEHAKKIISFIAQFENELVRIWNKPKFALNANYVITLDKLSQEIIEKIINHSNIKEQIDEWKELKLVEDDFNIKNIFEENVLGKQLSEKYKYLPIDTKYFKDLEYEILGLFDNLDEALDGRLIHSENYQALNTLLPKYKEKVQLIYIDPPFNTGEDFAYVDKFQDSTWLTLMFDRIKLGRELLNETGSFYLNLDINANYLGRFLMDIIFEKDNFKNEIVWNTASLNVAGFKTRANNWVYAISTIYFYVKDKEKYLFNKVFYEIPSFIKNFFKFEGEDENGRYRISRYGEKIYLDEEKGDAITNVWNDILSFNYAAIAANESFKFQTQKPEKLLERIIKASSNEGHLVLDFFAGSATTQAVAHKMNRKWLGVELGQHFFDVDIPRMKKVLAGVKTGISKDLEKEGKLKKGGFFKYYEFEQYENTLRKIKYKNYEGDLFVEGNKVFEEYVFFGDEKLAFEDVIKENKDKILKINFDNLYPNIDWSETLSNLLGKPIKKIKPGKVILQDGDQEREIRYDFENMSEEEKIEFLRLIKPLIWWGG